MDISQWVAHWARWSPTQVALRFEESEIDYRELEWRVGSRAAFLLSRGVAAGDRVAYLGWNSPHILETLFACARVGAIFVPLNARMPPAELDVFLSDAEPRLLIAEADYWTLRARRRNRPRYR